MSTPADPLSLMKPDPNLAARQVMPPPEGVQAPAEQAQPSKPGQGPPGFAKAMTGVFGGLFGKQAIDETIQRNQRIQQVLKGMEDGTITLEYGQELLGDLVGKSKPAKEALSKMGALQKVMGVLGQLAMPTPRFEKLQEAKAQAGVEQTRQQNELAQIQAQSQARLAALNAPETIEAERRKTEEGVRGSQLMYKERGRQALEENIPEEARAEFRLTGKYSPAGADGPTVIGNIPGDKLAGKLDPSGAPLQDAFGGEIDPKGTYSYSRDGKIYPTESPLSGYARQGDYVLPGIIEAQLAQGMEIFNAGSDTPITKENIAAYLESDPDTIFRMWFAGNKWRAVPANVKYAMYTIGNEIRMATGFTAGQIGKGEIPAIGVARTPTTTVQPQLTYNPQTGEYVQSELVGQTIPSTPGLVRQPSPTAPPTAPPAAPGEPSPAAPALAPPPPQAPPTAQAPPQAPSPGATPNIRGIPAGSFNTLIQRVTPVREAHAQIFGDPTQPEFTPMLAYADLADDPNVQRRVGTALRHVLDQIRASGTMEKNTFGDWVKNLTGLKMEMSRATAAVPADVFRQMEQNPREMELFNRTVESLSTVIGLRGLTRASATQATANRLEADVPLVGINVFSTRSFYDKLIPLSEMTYLGTVGMPGAMYVPKELEDIKGLPTKLKGLRDAAPTTGARKVLGGPGQAPAVGTVKGGYRFKGGDPARPSSWEKVDAGR